MLQLLVFLVSVLSLQIPQVSTGTEAWELGTRIVSDVSGQITAIRYFRLAENLGAHIGRVWASTGEKLAEAQFTDETASGWQEQALPMPLAVQAGSVFTVSVGMPGGVHFPILPQGFDKPTVDGHLTYRAGAFVGTPGQFPASESVGNYFRDVVFVADKQPVLTVGSAAVQLDAFGSIVVDGFPPGAVVTVKVEVTDGKSTAKAVGELTIPVEPR